jgi:TonB-dependent starch-binding outer membrane protein SusC
MKMKLLAGLFALFAIPLSLWSQEKTVPIINSALSGRVVDAVTRQVLADAVVLIKGTTHEVTTNSEGSFSFKTGQKLPYTLLISFVGYQTLEYVANSNDVVVALQPINNQLNDVVVVGYGTQRKSSITGAISVVDAKAIAHRPYNQCHTSITGRQWGVR